MSDIQEQYVKITNLDLNSSQIGKNINDRFSSIDDNFKKIIESNYLSGAPGQSITTRVVTIDENLLDTFASLIVGDYSDYVGDYENRINNVKTQLQSAKLTIIEGYYNDTLTQLSSFPFGFKDTTYIDAIKNIDTIDKTKSDHIDLSCVICYNFSFEDNQGKYEKIQMFPSLYYDDEVKNFCWMINGNKTKLVARGPAGTPGPAGVGEKGDKGNPGDPGKDGKDGEMGPAGASLLIAFYEDTETDDVKNILKFYYQTSNNTWDWIPVDSEDIERVPLVENGVVLACKGDSNEDAWCWGLLHKESSNSYTLNYGGLLSNVIGSKGMSLSELMKYNDYLFIPTSEDKTSGHRIKGSDNTLEFGPWNESGEPTNESSKFVSNYSEHVFNGTMTISGDVTIDGKLTTEIDDMFIANGAKKVVDENNSAINEGSAENPVYFENGIPVECELVSTAKKLAVDDVGSKISPVYFKNGIPVACDTADEEGWVIGGNTDGAHKLITSEKIIGDPILDENGEPKYEIEYKITPLSVGHSYNEEEKIDVYKPVYFEEGIPVECNEDLDINIKGNAETATKATEADYAISAGDSEHADSADSATNSTYSEYSTIATKLSADRDADEQLLYNIGKDNKPVYFKDGIPVECGEKLDVNIAGNSEHSITTEKLKESVNISITGGVEGTPTEFDGSQDIEIPVTEIKENYLTWGNYDDEVIDYRVNPIDVATNNELNPNRLSFINPDDIIIEYSNSEGAKWEPYNLTNEDKLSFVTTGLSKELYLGSVKNQTTSLDRLRITLNAPYESLYCAAKKLLIHTNQNGVTDYKIDLYALSVGNLNVMTEKNEAKLWAESYKHTFNITGEDGWYAIPLNFDFGGSDAAINNIRSIRIELYFKGEKNDTKQNTCMVDNIALHGESYTDVGHPLAKTNSMYSWDVHRNVKFENNLVIDNNIYASSIEVHDIELADAKLNNIMPVSSISSIGKAENYWPNAYIDDINTNYSESIKSKIDYASITHANIEQANISNIINDNVSIQSELPDNNYLFSDELKYEVINNGKFIEHDKANQGIDPKEGIDVSHEDNFGEILIKTSQLDSINDDTIDIKIPNLYIPIGLTYTNDYYLNFVGTEKWANINMTNIKATVQIDNIDETEPVNIEIKFPDYTLPLNENHYVRRRNGAIYYAFCPEFVVKGIKLKSTDKGYEDCKLRLTELKYTLDRTFDAEAKVDKTGDGVRVSWTYIHGIFICNDLKDLDNQYIKEGFNTDRPLKMPIIITNTLIAKGKINCDYYSNKPHNKIYLSKDGILMVNGYSKLKIVPPSDYKGSGKLEDYFGYIEVYQHNEKHPEQSITKRKSLFDILQLKDIFS